MMNSMKLIFYCTLPLLGLSCQSEKKAEKRQKEVESSQTEKNSKKGAEKEAAVISVAFLKEDALKSVGYKTMEHGAAKQSEWDAQTFGKATVKFQKIKATEPMSTTAGGSSTYQRYKVYQETYATVEAASYRAQNIRKRDPKLNTKMKPELLLRNAYAEGKHVYVVTTDVMAFAVADRLSTMRSVVEKIVKESVSSHGHSSSQIAHKDLERVQTSLDDDLKYSPKDLVQKF